MFCTLPYNLPGEKWIALTEYKGKFLISNKRRIKRFDGTIMKIKYKGIFETHFEGQYAYINVSICAFEHFNEADIQQDTIFEKYKKHKRYNDNVLDKLRKGIELTPEDITFCTLNIDLPGEKWKRTVYFCKNYEVSNLGRVRYYKSKKLVGLSYDSYGYIQIHLWSNNTRITTKIHRVVAETWIPKTEEDIRLGRYEVNHKDGNKLNNSVENLEWVTGQENIDHYNTILRHLK